MIIINKLNERNRTRAPSLRGRQKRHAIEGGWAIKLKWPLDSRMRTRWDVLIQNEHQISIRLSIFPASPKAKTHTHTHTRPTSPRRICRCSMRRQRWWRRRQPPAPTTFAASICNWLHTAVINSHNIWVPFVACHFINSSEQGATGHLFAYISLSISVYATIQMATILSTVLYLQPLRHNIEYSSFHFDDNCRVSWLYKHKHLIICFLV